MRPSALSSVTSSPMTSLQSPTIGTSAVRFLEISAGSMSAWMTLASGANVDSFAGHPVVEARTEADQQIAALQGSDGGHVPCMPGMPMFCGWLSGKHPESHQRGHHRDAGQLGELTQFFPGAWALSTPPPT